MPEYPIAYSFPKDRYLDLALFVFFKRRPSAEIMGNFLFGYCWFVAIILAVIEPYFSQTLFFIVMAVGVISAVPMNLLFGVQLALSSVNVYEFSEEYVVSFSRRG